MKMKMLAKLTLAVGICLWPMCYAVADTASAGAPAPTSQPSGISNTVRLGQLRLLANQDMAKGDYVSALPMLEKVSEMLTDQPDMVGPVLEQIRICRRQIAAGSKAPPVRSTVAAVDGAQRNVHPAPAPGQVVELAIKELGNFDYDAENGGNIPDDVKRLAGCRFQTSGYMIPLDQAESISEFALVPSLFSCCYGQPPQVQHTIVVHCPKGKAVSYFPDELTVEGTLHVEEQRDGGFIVSIFQIDAMSVRAAPK